MKTWTEHLIYFYKNLTPPKRLPNDILWLYPQQDKTVLQVAERFCYRFFNDTRQRKLMLGINPGRFGAGVTGVNFTAARLWTKRQKKHIDSNGRLNYSWVGKSYYLVMTRW
ncbi:MAG: hypothetical protein C4329_14765 [Chitinophagaceae bacterium]